MTSAWISTLAAPTGTSIGDFSETIDVVGLGHGLHPVADFAEPFSSCGCSEAWIEIDVIVGLARQRARDAVSDFLDRLTRGRVGDFGQQLEMAERMPSGTVGQRPEERCSFRFAFDVGLLGEEAIAHRRLTLASKAQLEVAVGLRRLELWHEPEAIAARPRDVTATHLLPPRRHYDCAVVTIDWDVIKQAALAGLFVLVPAIVVLTLVLDENSASIWIYIFGLILVFGFMTAGYGAGRIRSDTPMIHGAIAGLACYVAIQLFGVVSRLIRGDSINPWQYPFLAIFSAALGASGALFADWYRRKDARA